MPASSWVFRRALVRWTGLWRAATDVHDVVFDRTLAAGGVNPMEVRFAYRYRARGGYIAELRRNRGLDHGPA